tara:strand:+ start:401 stop:820 length:420 start_codon:yes stop_codon:yes gene_type:complete
MIDTERYEGHTPGPWVALHRYWRKEGSHGGGLREEGAEDAGNYAKSLVYTEAYLNAEDDWGIPTLDWSSVVNGVCIENMATANLVADAPLLLAEVKRLQSEPTVTVDDYHKKGHLYVTVRFPNGDEYVGLVEKWEGDEE